ncbi:hypothetical protein H4Q26_017943 [Puccinia striiformis f. sp. tritici PST-130]|nr:hypothetical protein H4Q26_017943 [Puccinia striiformis f. sp. tritici PST-130]
MPSHRRRNSLPASYKVPITQPSFSPTMLFHDEKSATQYLKKIVRHVKLGGGIITLAQLGRLRIQFEEITHFLISNGFSTHPDEFTVYFWNCLSPQLKSALSDALIWDGHLTLADIYSIETLPPYNILIQYIHRCYSSPDNPNETPSRIYITSQENQQSNQNYSTHSSMEERETEDQSPVINFVDSVSLDTPSFEPLTPVDIINEKVDTEGNISQNFSGEPESVIDLVEENQSFNMNSVENLPEESIITEDHSFRIDNPYFPECLSQSEWEFQSILSKTSSLNLLETINPLHYMPEEPFLTKSEDQNYISPSLIPSSPALTNTLEISTIQSLDEANNVQKDPGKNLEPIIKSNSITQARCLSHSLRPNPQRKLEILCTNRTEPPEDFETVLQTAFDYVSSTRNRLLIIYVIDCYLGLSSATVIRSVKLDQRCFWTLLWKRDHEQECEDNHDCLLPAMAHLQPGLPGPCFGSEIKNKLLMMIVIAARDFLFEDPIIKTLQDSSINNKTDHPSFVFLFPDCSCHRQEIKISSFIVSKHSDEMEQAPILQTTKRKQDEDPVHETDHTKPNFDFPKLNAYKESTRPPADRDCNKFITVSDDM